MVKDWPGYNLAQQNEVFIFLDRLPEAAIMAAGNKDLWKGSGRPPKKLYDILVCLAIQGYTGFSDRRSIGVIELFTRFANIPVDIPCYKSLSNYRNNPLLQSYMDKLTEVITKPLCAVETDFSTDATGISTQTFSSWYSLKVGKETRHRDHIMAHITTSRLLNAAVAVSIDCSRGKDSQYLREHINRVRKNFRINDWSGDSAYLSRANCDAVSEAGGTPWFKPKKNTTKKPKGSVSWKKMVREFKENPDNANAHYHKRSNSESTNSAKKRKFGDSVRSKNSTAKENEEYMKWVCYNLSVLSRACFEFGIKPRFS